MKNIILLLLASTVLTIYSCGPKQEYKGASADLSMQEAPQSNQKSAEKAENTIDRKIIKEGEVSFETSSISETKSLITRTVKELNGYISKDNVNDYTDKIEHRLVIRVPSDKFDLLLQTISESADKLDSKNVDVLDVTAEYIDIEARLKTKKALEDRYKELLKQATKVDEILNIEKEIGQLRAEIESIEGQMNYLKDRISFSTLTVSYYQKINSGVGFTTKLGKALKSGWDGFLLLLIGVTHLWMFLLIAVVIIYVIARRRRNLKKNAI